MWYKEIVKEKGSQNEIKEVSAIVEFSMGDLKEWKNTLEASLKTDLKDSTKQWTLTTIENINSSLNKQK